jgi:hypothetical protein
MEGGLQPLDERRGSRFGQAILQRHTVHFGLDPHMCGGFDLQVAAFAILVEVTRERTHDVFGSLGRVLWPSIRLL